MATALEEFQQHLSRAKRFLTREDWKCADATPGKAFVAALMASAAYLEIRDFELDQSGRVKLVPCLAYQELAARRQGVAVWEYLRRTSLGDEESMAEPVIVVTERLVAVVQKMSNVIFVALRGTRFFHGSDWRDDLKIAFSGRLVGTTPICFHRGFHDAVVECLPEVGRTLQRLNPNSKIPVYVVGHSLGGAMAGVAHTIRDNQFINPHTKATFKSAALAFHSAYTFGMPRFCDSRGATGQTALHHTYSRADPVPYLPPLKLGYSDAGQEYCLGIFRGWRQCARPNWSIFHAATELLSGYLPHTIEGYVRQLGLNLS